MSTASTTDDLISFIEDTPTIVVNIQVHTRVKVDTGYKYHTRSVQFQLPDPQVERGFNVEEYKLSAILKRNEYKANKSANKMFCIKKRITAPYTLIERLIRERLVCLKVIDESSKIAISYEKQYAYYEESVENRLLACFCGPSYFLPQTMQYQITHKTAQEWTTLVEEWITKRSLRQDFAL